MGISFVSQLLSFVRVVRNGANLTDSKVQLGGGEILTGEHFSSPGDDAHPLPGDWPLVSEISRTGNVAAVGYVDPKNASTAQPGEKRIYSRDENGDEVARVHLKNTGEVEIVNALGYIRLLDTGDVDINGVIISTLGDVTLPAGRSLTSDSVVVDGKELKDHTHGGVDPGVSNTGPNN